MRAEGVRGIKKGKSVLLCLLVLVLAVLPCQQVRAAQDYAFEREKISQSIIELVAEYLKNAKVTNMQTQDLSGLVAWTVIPESNEKHTNVTIYNPTGLYKGFARNVKAVFFPNPNQSNQHGL